MLLLSCSKPSSPINILIFSGGHDFEREAFFKLFEQMPDISYKEVIQPAANNMYASAEIDSFDVLVFYDMVQEISDEQKSAFMALLEKGKNMLFMHHSLVSYQQWSEFEKIIGGRYFLANDSLDISESTYSHDVKIPVSIADTNHPVTHGLDNFIIHDEVYGNLKVLPSVHPLLTTDHPESEKHIAWTNSYGRSQIVYIQLGHDHHAYDDIHFRHLVSQSIHWLKSKKD